MRPPVIGLTAFRRDLPTYLGAQTDLYTLDPSYADGISRAGGLPVILPHNEDPQAVLDLLDRFPPGPFLKEDGQLLIDAEGHRVG